MGSKAILKHIRTRTERVGTRNMNAQQKTKGFTIIEVVFLALPALQRNQRDQQRRTDVGRFVSAVQSFKSNNNGRTPLPLNGTAPHPTVATFTTQYLEDNFNDPSTGDPYVMTATATAIATPPTVNDIGEVHYYQNATCDNSGNLAALTGSWAVATWLEGSNDYFCQKI